MTYNYWVIDKDTQVKVSPTRVKSVVPSFNVDNANSKSDIASHILPTAATLTIIDPNQREPPIKLPICIEQDSMQCRTSVLIDSASTLNFLSRELLTRN